MADRFIDLDEIQIYGPYAVRMIRERVADLVPEFKKGMQRVAEELEDATATTRGMVGSAREAAAGVRERAQVKGPLLRQATSLLGRFSKHLDTHPGGGLDRRTFFPEDGTARGVGRSAPRVLLALGRIASELKKPACPVRDRDAWRTETQELMTALAPVVEHSHNARTERAAITPELEAARQAWLQTYLAAKCGVECVLRLTGKLHLLPAVFYDLAVPGTAKVTEPPPDPPADRPEDEAFGGTTP